MRNGQPSSVGDFTIGGGKIVAIEFITDPERLRQLDVTLLDKEAQGCREARDRFAEVDQPAILPSRLTGDHLSTIGGLGWIGGGVSRTRRATPDASDELVHFRRDAERVIIALLQANNVARSVGQVKRHVLLILGVSEEDRVECPGDGGDGSGGAIDQGGVDTHAVPRWKIAQHVLRLAQQHDTSLIRYRFQSSSFRNRNKVWDDPECARCRNPKAIRINGIPKQHVRHHGQLLAHTPFLAVPRCELPHVDRPDLSRYHGKSRGEIDH